MRITIRNYGGIFSVALAGECLARIWSDVHPGGIDALYSELTHEELASLGSGEHDVASSADNQPAENGNHLPQLVKRWVEN